MFINAPVVTIIGVLALVVVIWKITSGLYDKMYSIRIDGLNDQINAIKAWRDGAVDQLVKSNTELEKAQNEIDRLKDQVAGLESKIALFRPDLVENRAEKKAGAEDEVHKALTRLIFGNTATIATSGVSLPTSYIAEDPS